MDERKPDVVVEVVPGVKAGRLAVRGTPREVLEKLREMAETAKTPKGRDRKGTDALKAVIKSKK